MAEYPTRIGNVADEVRRLHDEKDEAQRQEHMAKAGERAAEARVAELEALGEDLCRWADEVRGHYGIERCSGPGQKATEWDEIQDGLRGAAAVFRIASKGQQLNNEETP